MRITSDAPIAWNVQPEKLHPLHGGSVSDLAQRWGYRVIPTVRTVLAFFRPPATLRCQDITAWFTQVIPKLSCQELLSLGAQATSTSEDITNAGIEVPMSACHKAL